MVQEDQITPGRVESGLQLYLRTILLEGEERSEIIEELKSIIPKLSLPYSWYMDDGDVIVGFNEEGIREALT